MECQNIPFTLDGRMFHMHHELCIIPLLWEVYFGWAFFHIEKYFCDHE